MIKKIDHIGIAVKNLDVQIAFYRDVLGLNFVRTEDLPERKLKIAVLETGDVELELLQPLSEDTPVGKFLATRGEGIHHIAYQVSDIQSEIAQLISKGVQMIDQEPRTGADGTVVAFLHPKSAHGVLTELCQRIRED